MHCRDVYVNFFHNFKYYFLNLNYNNIITRLSMFKANYSWTLMLINTLSAFIFFKQLNFICFNTLIKQIKSHKVFFFSLCFRAEQSIKKINILYTYFCIELVFDCVAKPWQFNFVCMNNRSKQTNLSLLCGFGR